MSRISNLKVGVRLAVAFGLVAVLLGAIVVMGIRGSSSQSAATEKVDKAVTVTKAAMQLKYRSADFNGWQTAYAFDVRRGLTGATLDTGDSRKAFLASADAFRSELRQFKAVGLDDGTRQKVEAVESNFAEFMRVDGDVIAKYRQNTPASIKAADELVLGREIELFNKTAKGVDSIVKDVATDSAAANAAANSSGSSSRRLMLGAGCLALVLAVGLALLITRSISGPLRKAVKVLGDVAKGDLTSRLDVSTTDEVGQMATSLNTALESVAGAMSAIAGNSTTLASSSEELSATSAQMGAAAEETSAQAGAVSAAAEQVSANVASVSTGAEEMGASIREIAKNATEAARVAAGAVATAPSRPTPRWPSWA